MAIVTTELEGLPSWAKQRTIGQYGLSLDKQNDEDETPIPYSFTWYQELRSMRGSAYSQSMSGLVHTENLAASRSEQARTRTSARLIYNSLPITSYNRLGQWETILAVPRRLGDTAEITRQKCAAKFKAAIGPSAVNEDEAIATLLGDNFVQVYRQTGVDLDTPPLITYWPGVNPGPASYDLGGGAWVSERANLVVEVKQIPGESVGDFLELMNTQLFALLDTMLPAWATFGWATNLDTCFLLDISQMDFDGMCP